jgi:putative FmdB family regulatory protein
MPTYEYECTACGHRLDHFQSMSDPALRKCPKCGKLRLKRLIGAGAGVIFKGSGFYTTDYRSPSYHTAKTSDSAPKPETKTETTEKTPANPPPAPAKKSKSSKKK